jgi:hypothetical protein
MLQLKVQYSVYNHEHDALLRCMIAMMMQHHALTKDGMYYDAWLLPGELYSKAVIVINLFNLSKIIWAKMEGATFKCCNQNSQQYKVQHQERIDESLNNGLKGLLILINV